MDTLTTSREDSPLYCITSENKIINHKWVENKGDFWLNYFSHPHSSTEGP